MNYVVVRKIVLTINALIIINCARISTLQFVVQNCEMEAIYYLKKVHHIFTSLAVDSCFIPKISIC